MTIRLGGSVTFSWTGVENVMQANEEWDTIFGGMASGNPTAAGSFTQVFDTDGTFRFRSTST
eukprot:COSAG04_NODE_17736_length_460_cov_0.972299_1_plen_61_part_01